MNISQLNGYKVAVVLMHYAIFILFLSVTSFSRNYPLVFYSIFLLSLINSFDIILLRRRNIFFLTATKS